MTNKQTLLWDYFETWNLWIHAGTSPLVVCNQIQIASRDCREKIEYRSLGFWRNSVTARRFTDILQQKGTYLGNQSISSAHLKRIFIADFFFALFILILSMVDFVNLYNLFCILLISFTSRDLYSAAIPPLEIFHFFGGIRFPKLFFFIIFFLL